MASSEGGFPLPQAKSKQEEGTVFAPKFGADGLISAIVVDAESNEVLMLGHMNAESLSLTISSGEAHYWSRSRKEIWHKGATSGNVQKIEQILTDCDQDALVLKVRVTGAAATCHTGRVACFYREVPMGTQLGSPLREIDSTRLFDPKQVYSDKS